MDWFLYNNVLRHESVKWSTNDFKVQMVLVETDIEYAENNLKKKKDKGSKDQTKVQKKHYDKYNEI